MVGAICSRPASDVEPEDRITWTPENTTHHADVLRSHFVTSGLQQLTIWCVDCRKEHVWEISRTQLVTVQRTPR